MTSTRQVRELPYRATSLRDAFDCVLVRIDFTTNSHFKGRNTPDKITYGELPFAYDVVLNLASQAHDFYIVYSYTTPVAWYANGIWEIPSVYYSKTTSRHQNLVRKAIN